MKDKFEDIFSFIFAGSMAAIVLSFAVVCVFIVCKVVITGTL